MPLAEDDLPIQFLFRKRGKPLPTNPTPTKPWQRIFRGKKQRMKSVQWTDRLAGLVDETRPSTPEPTREKAPDPEPLQSIPVSLRLEGPYFSPADPSRYTTVVCLVAGTGISGALAIASAFTHLTQTLTQTSKFDEFPTPSFPWRKCVIIWSVKKTDDIELPFLELKTEGLEFKKFLTGSGAKRVDLEVEVREAVKEGGRAWAYCSGPAVFIEAGKEACGVVGGVEFYGASWDV